MKRRARDTGIFLDFDGTLSEIVHIPSEARPVAGAAQVLQDLAQSYPVVTIVSGRSAHELLEWLGPELDIWGVHGAQRVRDGEVVLSRLVAPFADLMRQVRDEAQDAVAALDLPGVIVEDKEVIIGLHFRAAEDPEEASVKLDRLAGTLAERHGLLRAGGRLAYELRPPLSLSKKTVVLEVAQEAGLRGALFAGDDRVDLPGFDALDELDQRGLATLRVGVLSDEAPEELVERSDVTVEGPAGMLDLLRSLL